jgi:hypothetical protein
LRVRPAYDQETDTSAQKLPEDLPSTATSEKTPCSARHDKGTGQQGQTVLQEFTRDPLAFHFIVTSDQKRQSEYFTISVKIGLGQARAAPALCNQSSVCALCRRAANRSLRRHRGTAGRTCQYPMAGRCQSLVLSFSGASGDQAGAGIPLPLAAKCGKVVMSVGPVG